jgi:AcrR family transcriptional regulator
MRAMSTHRLDAEGRRQAIIDAALPLFARKGFAATTTRELAAAAGVSEALIFKHFPSKAALYAEILRSGCDGDPELERLKALPPSTATLVVMVDALVRYFVIDVPADPPGGQARHRLMVASFLEDGEFARLAYEWVQDKIVPLFAASLRAAAVGDIEPGSPVTEEDGFWFAHHLAMMLSTISLPGRSSVPHAADTEDLVRQARWFILRGLGLGNAAIAAFEPVPARCRAPAGPSTANPAGARRALQPLEQG